MPYDDTQHIISHGKKISFSDTVNGTYTPVYGNFDIDLPDGELSAAEITNDDSPDFHKANIPGMYDPGKASFKYKYGRTAYAALDTLYLLATVAATRNAANKFWKVLAIDGSTWTFKGFLSKHTLPMGADDDVPEVEGEITVSGKVTFVAGAGS